MAAEGVRYVTFILGDETFGLEISWVQEIIRVPPLVRVPRAPDHVEGLASLRGQLLPVVSGRGRLGLPPAPPGEAARVVVLEKAGQRLGFLVDRVREVVEIPAEAIEPLGTDERSEYVGAVAKLSGGERLILLLDGFMLLGDAGNGGGPASRGGRAAQVRTAAAAEQAVDVVQWVSFRVGDEEYALDIHDVQEIVRGAGRLSRVPGLPPEVRGLFTLRQRLLPVVSLRARLGLPDRTEDAARILVARVRQDGAVHTVGLEVDAVHEVIRLPRDAVEAVPALLGAAASRAVAGVGKLNAGERLVYLLDPASLCDAAELGRLGAGAEAAQQVGGEHVVGGTVQVVVFRLAGGEFAAPIEQVQEIIRPGAITRVPRAPDWVEGVINLRGNLVPVVDLRRRLGLPTEVSGELTRIIITDSQGSRTGLVVDGVREVLKVPEAAVEEVPEMLVREVDTTGMAGVVNLEQRLVLLLNFTALLTAEERAALAGLEQMSPDYLGGEAEDLATEQGGEVEDLATDQGFDS